MNNVKIALKLPENYDPLRDEVYMSPYMLHFFQNKLENMLSDIKHKGSERSNIDLIGLDKYTDDIDQAAVEGVYFQESILQEYEKELKYDILDALAKIKNGSYGYCEETGEPIEVKRLLTIPTAKYTVEVRTKIERMNQKAIT